jgi:hypothetical protein
VLRVRLRNIIAAGLVIGAAATVLAQILGASRAKPAAVSAGTNATPNPPPVAGASHKVAAYYFHRTVRCETCRAIEAQAHATIEAEFADALKTGALEWHVINVEEAGNEPFVKEYDLTAPALVLVDSFNGRQVRWSKLNRIWELAHTPPVFTQYVQDELRSYLGGP